MKFRKLLRSCFHLFRDQHLMFSFPAIYLEPEGLEMCAFVLINCHTKKGGALRWRNSSMQMCGDSEINW